MVRDVLGPKFLCLLYLGDLNLGLPCQADHLNWVATEASEVFCLSLCLAEVYLLKEKKQKVSGLSQCGKDLNAGHFL